jgi:hypothetical protein
MLKIFNIYIYIQKNKKKLCQGVKERIYKEQTKNIPKRFSFSVMGSLKQNKLLNTQNPSQLLFF